MNGTHQVLAYTDNANYGRTILQSILKKKKKGKTSKFVDTEGYNRNERLGN